MQGELHAALVDLGRYALISANLPTLLDQAAGLVATALRIEYSMIFEPSPECGLMLRAGAGWQDGAVGATYKDGDPSSLIHRVMRNSTPVVVNDWRIETDIRRPELPSTHEILSSLYVSIPGSKHTCGVLGAAGTSARFFAQVEVLFMEAVAAVLGLAFEHAERVAAGVEGLARDIKDQTQAILEERKRLARDLHDSITQALYGITLYAEVAQRTLATGDIASTSDHLSELQRTAQEVLSEMRLLIFDLRPPVLEQVGLAAALRGRLEAVEGRSNLEIVFKEEGECSLPAPVEQALYRIAQESLSNVLHHAQAHHVTVTLLIQNSCVTLEISDDGVGFDPAHTGERGLGLRGIAERVEQLEGQLAVQSAPGHGTQIRVEVLL